MTRRLPILLLLVFAPGCGNAVSRHARNLSSPDVEVRRDAARALGEIGADAAGALPELKQATGDEDPEVRRLAAHAIGRLGNRGREAAPAVEELLDDSDRRVRLVAAYALVELTPDSAASLQVLEPAAASGDVRAIVALGRLGGTACPAVPTLERLARAGNRLVRQQAGEALEKIRGQCPQ